MTRLDSRLHACRNDLADIRLQDLVDADHFVAGKPMQVAVPILPVHKLPASDAMQLTQALLGERVSVFDEQEGWAWVQLETDSYVGYVSANALTSCLLEPTHRVSVPSTFLYPMANLKSQPVIPVTLNARLTATGADGKFLRLADDRFVFAEHVRNLDEVDADFVAVAERFRNAPYYWGGKSVYGLDCSGLVQLALEASGQPCPRDSDMQQETVGSPLKFNDLDGLRRGDLIFWSGHVGIVMDGSTLLHANGHHMMVVAEPLHDAIDRIASTHGPITQLKRI